jgi:hypothetical protein
MGHERIAQSSNSLVGEVLEVHLDSGKSIVEKTVLHLGGNYG